MAATIVAGLHLFSTANVAGLQQFSSSLRDLRIEFLGVEQLGKTIGDLGQGLVNFGKLGVAALSSVTEEAIKLNFTATQIVAAAGDELGTTSDLLAQRFLSLRQGLPATADELGQVGLNAARAGVKTLGAVDAIALVSTKIAALSDDLDPDKASEGLLTLALNFKKSGDALTESVNKMGDSLAVLADESVGTAGQILNIAKRASSTADIAGFTETQILALATAVRNAGVSSEVGGTAIAQFISNMTKNTAKFAAAAGMSDDAFKQLIGGDQKRGFEALQLVLKGIATGADGAEASATDLMQELNKVGITGSRALAALSGLVSQVDDLTRLNSMAANATGKLDAKFAVLAASAKLTFKTFTSALDALKTRLGLVILPIVLPFVRLLTRLVETLGRLPRVVYLVVIAAGALVTTITLLAGAWLMLEAAIIATAASLAFAALSAMALMNAMGYSAMSLLLGLAMLPTTLSGMMAGVLAALGPIGVAIGVAVAGFALMVVWTVALSEELDSLFSAVTAVVDPLYAMADAFASVFGQVGGVGGFFISFIRAGLWPVRALLFSLETGFRMLRLVGMIAVENLLVLLKPMGDLLGRFAMGIGRVVNWFRDLAIHFGLLSKEGSLMETILTGVGAVLRFIAFPIRMILRLLSFMFTIGLGFWAGVIEALFDTFALVFAPLHEAFDEIVSAFGAVKEAFAPIFDAFSDLFAALGISTEGFDLFGVVVQAVAFGVRVLLLPVSMFLRLLTSLVKIGTFFVTGVIRVWATVMSVMTAPIAVVVGWLKDFVDWLRTGKDGVLSLSDSLMFFFEWLSQIPRRILDRFSLAGVAEWIHALGAMLFDALMHPIDTFLSALGIIGDVFSGAIPLSIPSLDSGGLLRQDTLVQAHKGELIAPLDRLPDVISSRPVTVTNITAAAPAPAVVSAGSGSGAPVNLSLSIPVSVMLDGLELGRVLVQVSEEEIRRQFGTKGIRLAGVG